MTSGPTMMITIDGPSGSGKSTVSRLLARRLGFSFLDTGAMYRAVGYKTLHDKVDEEDREALTALLENLDLHLLPGREDTRVLLDGRDISTEIRTAEMGLVASRISAIAAVRKKLTELQRRIGGEGNFVAEGRDMGTVVFPGAPCKFFLDATPEERARRRTAQLAEKGEKADYESILAQIKKRDLDDSSRPIAPLVAAADAVHIDSSAMTIEEVLAFMTRTVQAKINDNSPFRKGARQPMDDGRTLKRRHLIYYLEIFDEDSGELLGHLVDITTRGIKLVGKKALAINRDYRMRMTLPEGYFKENVIHFEGRALWSGNDVNPDFYDTGFEVANLAKDVRKIIIKLINWLGFNE